MEVGKHFLCYSQSGVVEDVTSVGARIVYSFLPMNPLLLVDLFDCFWMLVLLLFVAAAPHWLTIQAHRDDHLLGAGQNEALKDHKHHSHAGSTNQTNMQYFIF